MSYRIDIESLRRYQADGVTSKAMTEAERRRFEQAVEEALSARASAGGPGEIDGTTERVFIVEEGDSLWEIAEELHLDFDEFLALNERDDISDPAEIDPGDVVFVPHTSPEEAAQSPRDAQGVPIGEDDFIDGLRERGNDLEYADDPAAVDYDAEIDAISQDIERYLAALPADERQAALQRIYDHDWVDAGPAQMAIEQAAQNSGLALQPSSHTGPEAEAEAREIIAEAREHSDPQEALDVLEERYEDASSAVRAALDRSSDTREIAAEAGAGIIADARAEDDPADALRTYEAGRADAPERVQNALDRSSDAQAIIDDAAAWAAEPLDGELEGTDTPQRRTLETIERLDALTEGLGAELASEVVDALVDEIEVANQGDLQDYGGAMAGPNGTAMLMEILDRIAGTEAGDRAVNRLAEQLPVDMNTVRNEMNEAVSSGEAIPSLALAIASLEGVEGFRDEVFSAVEHFRDGTIAEQADDYHEHLDELSFLILNGGAAMTEEQLEAAIDDYIASNPDWEAEFQALQEQLADSGAGLLEQIEQLQALPDGVRADHQARIDALLDDPNAQLAVSTALQERPELVKGESGDALIETFNELGITGDHPLAVSLAGAYLRENVILPAGDIDPSDAQSLEEARTRLDETLRDNPGLAELLGTTADELDELADAFEPLIPEFTDDFDPQRYGIDVARNLNNTLDKTNEIFRDSPYNRAFRASALSIVGSGLANAIDAYGDDPSLRSALQVSIETARVGVDGAQLVDALLTGGEGSRVTPGLKLGGKFVHLFGAGLAGVDALVRLNEGDVVGAGLNAAVAGGVGYAVFGSSSLAGPVGFGIATLATLVQFGRDAYLNAQHNSRFETQATADFLAHAGFSEEAAQVLIDQSGGGHSAVPLLIRYGELHGLSPEQTVEWINAIAEGENGTTMLAALRDNLHNTLDEFDGDIMQFDTHADGFELASPSLGESRSGSLTPRSQFELDAILPQLDIESPQEYA
ncbi:LysM peptidoglycan-binding domain-containing protein [Halomonas sp. LR3S48]|uniref:LysM peptidoglycan-binding domain-containing protein n=1 Tax=Halomonas sp. LR3S48 TaxID=2982694 RepID=UPI0021E4E5BB|nr:LysM domain-containing protein [Halomonas sp. LR3S48]UYG02350.1 LysM peptidoglycan-binding domain-containing protein [Halomonas sp. LR3S48]